MHSEIFKNIPTSSALTIVKKMVLTVCGKYALDPLVNSIHELGHMLTLKLLLGVDSTIHLTIVPWRPPYFQLKEPMVLPKGLRLASVYAAGPLAGLLAIYSLSKLNNIRYEYFTGTPIMQAVTTGLIKPFFNSDQSWTTKTVLGWMIVDQLFNFIPLKLYLPQLGESKSDGYQILEALDYYQEK